MPQSGQIIPEWLHPHTAIHLNDNTEFIETVADAPEEGVKSIHVFTSPKGRDNVVLTQTNPTKYLEEYGMPNYKLYGQAGYMPFQALSSGYSIAHCMRVMPEDATYANVAIVAKVKLQEEVKDSAGLVLTPASMAIRFESSFIPEVDVKDDFEGLLEILGSETPDVDGYTAHPVGVAYSLGRGEYGNGFRIRLNSSPQADQENDYKNYRFEVLELENTITRKEFFNGSFAPDALVSSESLFLNDVVNDSELGSNRINVYISETILDELFALYTKVAPNTEVTKDEFDFIGGLVKGTTTKLPGLTIETTHADSVALDAVDGLAFEGGDEGSFGTNAEAPEAREDAIDAAYIKAFEGKYDKSILSSRRTPADVIMDAGYSDEVKRALVSLMVKRYDAQGYLDAGILNNITEAIEWGETMVGLGDRVFSKDIHHYKVRDPFSGKAIPVTITYFLANRLPIHIRDNGKHIPFVGSDYARLSGHIKNSLKPVVDADDNEIKKQLYDLRLNYFHATAENTFVRGTQGTSQTIWSDLSEENNMRVVLDMKRVVEQMVDGLQYDFAEAEDRARFTEEAGFLLQPYTDGRQVRSATVEFSMTPWEETRSILHCNLAVVFRTMAKRTIVEIDINKRA